ncbi:alpha/beta fold hydrolase [Zunongwangia endophytica]|uniref:Alpha/beta fold hydrolase n=1 Tax=Zunongwangia endophytica TaxID=1808945 RepID=A0ABV8H9A8_9FLAO|nr:alpha/beta hydrolase [Zunongwangia endophytica]MDN3594364.1 alpha/beta hydrolase [Zunongwangia endophytica]
MTTRTTSNQITKNSYTPSKFIIFLLLTFLLMLSKTSYGQLSYIFQTVEIEEYQGKKFILKGKIYYENTIENGSYAVLSAFSVSSAAKMINAPIYNDDAGTFYKYGSWSSYELTGKIDKHAKYFGVGMTISGTNNYYADDFELLVKDGKKEIIIPLKNAGFENDSLGIWQQSQIPEEGIVSISSEKSFSGSQSLYFDYSAASSASGFGSNANIGKFVDIDDIKLYYEIYGKGEPLLLLHGNNSSMSRFQNQLDYFKENYRVIGLDSRGQGKSTSSDTPLTYELMAEDVSKFIKELGLEKVNIIGWSDGGNIALILAMNHPEQVKTMAIMGSVIYNNKTSVPAKINKILRTQIAEMEKQGISKDDMSYRLKLLLLNEPNIDPESLRQIQAPTLVMAGQHDIVKEKHSQLIAEKIPHANLKIFKGAGHEAPEEIPEIFNTTVNIFFQANRN